MICNRAAEFAVGEGTWRWGRGNILQRLHLLPQVYQLRSSQSDLSNNHGANKGMRKTEAIFAPALLDLQLQDPDKV